MLARYWLGVWLPLIVFVVVVLQRAFIPENIHPWQIWWIIWILATSVTAGRVGWGLAKLHSYRKRTQAREQR